MEIKVEEKGDVVIFRVLGRLDAASAPQLETKMNKLIDQGNFKLVLNLSGVDYLSSAGMRLMLSISKKLKSLEGKLVACGLSDDVDEVVRMAGFHKVIEFFPNEDDCLTHLVRV